jgi:DNA repair exonuclease SbcCD ATPase subunit
MFTPTRLTVEGFRGFRKAETFEFNQPATELYGENRCCKSSTLNAIEWVLFGDGCAGSKTGIRERVGWVVENRHLPAPAVRVELEMEGPDGTYLVVRKLQRSGKRAAPDETVELTRPDGETVTGAAADEQLGGLLQSSFRDFLTTVYQHQEVIRAVLTQEPKERNDAIDRLLGLSDQRNLLGALDGADLRKRQKAMAAEFAAFEQQVQAALAARENDLAALRQEAQRAGLARNQLSGKAALDGAGRMVAALQEFAAEAGLELPVLAVPGHWHRLADLDKSARKAISWLRGQVPGIDEQQQLLKKRQQLVGVQAACEQIRKRWHELEGKTQSLDKDHGGRKGVEAKLAEAGEQLEAEQEQLRQTNGRAAVVREALDYLGTLEEPQPPCPVCETPRPGLVAKLQALWDGELKNRVANIAEKIEMRKAELKELHAVADQYQRLNDAGVALQQQQADARKTAATLLAIELGHDDDPQGLVVAELNRIGERLKQLEQAIQERQERLDAIEKELGLVRLVQNYLQQEEKKKVVETIQESEAFKQLEAIRDRVAQLVDDGEAIKNAVAEVAREQAETKLAAAGQTIDTYFRQLSGNPAVRRLQLAVEADKRTHRNSYDITDENGKDLTPILSQGDLNALALAIFLGLAATSGENSTFGFILLDDPSQSLGSEHKKQLARLLDQVARHKKVIVATMDAEFHDCLCQSLTKARKEYRFGRWTPEDGPSIVSQNALGGAPAGSERTRKPRLQDPVAKTR